MMVTIKSPITVIKDKEVPTKCQAPLQLTCVHHWNLPLVSDAVAEVRQNGGAAAGRCRKCGLERQHMVIWIAPENALFQKGVLLE